MEKKSKLHYFNPGHETAVLSGKVNYTPTTNVQKMQEDLALLPCWYAQPDDLTIVKNSSIAESYSSWLSKQFHLFPRTISESELHKEADKLSLEAFPWGLSPQSLHYFTRLKKKENLNLEIPEWIEKYKVLTGRQTAKTVLDLLKKDLTDMELPGTPYFFSNLESLEKYTNTHTPPFILKTPFSSSGRGLLWVYTINQKDKQWIEGAIRKQGEISIEAALNKTMDFAMEFLSDGDGKVVYKGLSIFGTLDRGAYSGNILGNKSYRESFLLEHVDKQDLEKIKDSLEKILSEVYGNYYRGCIGVDMLLYLSNGKIQIHPCVEINMRQTMGMVALYLSEHYVFPSSTGHFIVDFNNNPEENYKKHLERKRRYPLIIENRRIKSGYLSLCPIDKSTKYSAYILINE